MRQKQTASQIREKVRKHEDVFKANEERRRSELAKREKFREGKIKEAKERKQEQIQAKIDQWNEKLREKSKSPSSSLKEASNIFNERSEHVKLAKNSIDRRHGSLLDEKLNMISLKRIFYYLL